MVNNNASSVKTAWIEPKWFFKPHRTMSFWLMLMPKLMILLLYTHGGISTTFSSL